MCIRDSSKGASRGYILLRHVLKNCLLPVITLVGMNLGSLVSGAYIVETIFGWPGLGTTGMSAIYSRDYNMIMGTTTVSYTHLDVYKRQGSGCRWYRPR